MHHLIISSYPGVGVMRIALLLQDADDGVAGLGVVLTIGMLLTVVCNLVVLPALIE